MTYSSLSTLAILGLTCIALWLLVRLYTPRVKRGATRANKKQIGAHWHRRELYMLRNGGLPVDMRRVGE